MTSARIPHDYFSFLLGMEVRCNEMGGVTVVEEDVLYTMFLNDLS